METNPSVRPLESLAREFIDSSTTLLGDLGINPAGIEVIRRSPLDESTSVGHSDG